MIAIQAELLEVNEEKILSFPKIIDIYCEPEERESDIKQVNEASLNNDSPWTKLNAKKLFEIIKVNTKK